MWRGRNEVGSEARKCRGSLICVVNSQSGLSDRQERKPNLADFSPSPCPPVSASPRPPVSASQSSEVIPGLRRFGALLEGLADAIAHFVDHGIVGADK